MENHLQIGAKRAGRSLDDFLVVFVVTLGLGDDATVGARWVRSWFAPGQPFLAYPSIANLRWLHEAGFDVDATHDPRAIPEDRARQISDALRNHPENAELLLPVLAVAIRSVRSPEARAGLAAVVAAVEARPELESLIGRVLPELELMPGGAAK